ncbi:siphovirus ReqiPepy6 Gp37-like family protein [Curtobacterium sp. MCBD17_028]|uniref:siphovirus ReqiPepy6 Gp37-like family protein n=1 Tax=Curtobacterium sp. MCBD17_028 TaxID=2175670 RepID=UPI0021ABEDFB|nr:siphovirus ReqiPepy6 Gp37-like family protein [Curtobacterium sp. MCBD17_028]
MVWPRDLDLRRRFNPVRFWSSLTVVERHNVTDASPGTWSVTAQNEGLRDLLYPGRGAILYRNDGKVMSGPITGIQRGAYVSTISGESDTATISDRILFPSGADPITAQPVGYDNRSGAAEDVLLGYLTSNLGSGTTSDRREPLFRIPASQGRGSSVTINGRLEQLGTTIADIAELGGLHIDVVQDEDDDGPFLSLLLRPVADLSANIRFGTAGAFVGGVVGDDWSYTLSRPSLTRAIVAGPGVGKDRTFVQVVDSAAEALWGARIEGLVDQRTATDSTGLNQAGADALSSGAAPVTVSFTISDSPTIQYRRDWRVGDTVGVGIDGLDLTNVVREVTTMVTSQQGAQTEKVSAVVGSRDSSAWVSRTNKDVGRALRQLQLLRAV